MDGAPPHNRKWVWWKLSENFESRWMGNNGLFHWSALSPDFSPLDLFIWGYIKNNSKADPITTKKELMNKVRAGFNSLEP